MEVGVAANSGGLVIDTSVNLTTIIAILVWVATIAIAWSKFGGRIDILELRVSHMEKTLEAIAKTLELFQSNEKQLIAIQLQLSAVQSSHEVLNKTVEELRRGDGWIVNPGRESLNGEYKRE